MNTTHTLSTDDCAALRTMRTERPRVSHAIVADYRQAYGWYLAIHTTTRMPEGSDPTSVYHRHRFEVNGSNEVYRDLNGAQRMVASSDAWGRTTAKALANLVKPGDVLRLQFVIGNNTQPMKAAGFEHDQCFIEVWRGPDGKERLISRMLVSDIVSNTPYTMVDASYRPERDENQA